VTIKKEPDLRKRWKGGSADHIVLRRPKVTFHGEYNIITAYS